MTDAVLSDHPYSYRSARRYGDSQLSTTILLNMDHSCRLWYLTVEVFGLNSTRRIPCPFDLQEDGTPRLYSTKAAAFKRWWELHEDWEAHIKKQVDDAKVVVPII